MTSLRKLINAKCKECIYDPCAQGSWRQQVKECTSYDCPLYPVRPLPIAKKSSDLRPKPDQLTTTEPTPVPRVQQNDKRSKKVHFTVELIQGGGV